MGCTREGSCSTTPTHAMMLTRKLLRAAFPIAIIALTACAASGIAAPDGASNQGTPIFVRSELHFTSIVLSRRDSAGIVATPGGLLVSGVLNQSPLCFGPTSVVIRQGRHLVVRLRATEAPDCMTLVQGAFAYDLALPDLGAGDYDVDVLHQVQFRDGRVEESLMASARIHVR